MKRLLVAGVLLALTAGLCIWSDRALDRRVDRLLYALDDVTVVYRTSGADAASPYVDHFLARIEEETSPLPLFMPHEPIDSVMESACSLPALLHGDDATFEAEIARCRERLEHLHDSEHLSIKNLL